VTLKAEVEGTLGHTEEVEGVPVVQGHLHDLEVGHLEVEDRVELVVVHPLDLGTSVCEGRVHQLGAATSSLVVLVNDGALLALGGVHESSLNHARVRAGQLRED
jgi:hypothetical protein